MARRTTESQLLFELPPVPTDAIERRLRRAGHKAIAGVDEVGRGPLAGPVVEAAVILDATNIPDGLNDSKKLTASAREALFEQIMASAHVSVVAASVLRIDSTSPDSPRNLGSPAVSPLGGGAVVAAARTTTLDFQGLHRPNGGNEEP